MQPSGNRSRRERSRAPPKRANRGRMPAIMTRASISPPRRSTIRSSVVMTLALTTTIAASPVAHASAPADEAPADDAAAKRRADGLALYEQANAKYDAGDYPGAVDDFKASFDLLGDTLLLYNIAVCYDRMDEFDAALEYFKRYRAVAPAAEQAEVDRRVSSINARKAARSRSDGSTSPNEETTTTGPTERTSDARGPADTGSGSAAKPKIMTPTVWALAGVSVAALGVGLGFGLASSRRSNAADDACPELDGVRLCTAEGSDDLDRARQFGVVSAASLAVGGALAIAAVAVIATNATRAKKQRNRGAQARIFPTPLGLSGRF